MLSICNIVRSCVLDGRIRLSHATWLLRKKSVRRKLNTMAPEIAGKNVLIVDGGYMIKSDRPPNPHRLESCAGRGPEISVQTAEVRPRTSVRKGDYGIVRNVLRYRRAPTSGARRGLPHDGRGRRPRQLPDAPGPSHERALAEPVDRAVRVLRVRWPVRYGRRGRSAPQSSRGRPLKQHEDQGRSGEWARKRAFRGGCRGGSGGGRY
ncbi:hypothetical protein EDB84DRAFT_1098740 [Lactarius hengduanensis]|nr:hypothetical protein EDB84DRAFT_1098740 [Lactarius hengduanensis]